LRLHKALDAAGVINQLVAMKIAYIASWRNFIFAIFAEMSFSTATLHITH
jgi:hypothetical protein